MKRVKIVTTVILLMLAGYAGYHGVKIQKALQVLTEASKDSEVHLYWTVDDDLSETTPSFYKVLCGARPTDVNLDWPAFNSNREDSERFAKALSYFGSVEDFSADYDCSNIMLILKNLGSQPNLTSLNCFHAPVKNEITTVLEQFPSLVGISFVPSQVTGKGFPVMEKLQWIDLSWSPVTAEGLKDIARSPKLTRIVIGDHPHPSKELIKAIDEIKIQYPSLNIYYDGSD